MYHRCWKRFKKFLLYKVGTNNFKIKRSYKEPVNCKAPQQTVPPPHIIPLITATRPLKFITEVPTEFLSACAKT